MRFLSCQLQANHCRRKKAYASAFAAGLSRTGSTPGTLRRHLQRLPAWDLLRSSEAYPHCLYVYILNGNGFICFRHRSRQFSPLDFGYTLRGRLRCLIPVSIGLWRSMLCPNFPPLAKILRYGAHPPTYRLSLRLLWAVSSSTLSVSMQRLPRDIAWSLP